MNNTETMTPEEEREWARLDQQRTACARPAPDIRPAAVRMLANNLRNNAYDVAARTMEDLLARVELLEAAQQPATDAAEDAHVIQRMGDLLARYGEPVAGEDIMINVEDDDVYTLPLQPSGLTSGPRFVVHVPAAQPKRRPYSASGSLSEYGIFPECDAAQAQAPRACTCHPDDRPDGPCRERYAASECQALAAQAPTADADALDAARYRWLRKGESDDVAVVRGLGAMDYGMSAVVYTHSEEIDGDDLDAAIDAAIAHEQGD